MPDFRSGNSRLLAKTLDLLELPVAILDRRGLVVYVNSALCSLFAADATQLVGQECSWDVAADDRPHAALLTALAPPPNARAGKPTVRQLTTPIVFGSNATAQIFLPLLDSENLVHMTAVVLGDWQQMQHQLTASPPTNVAHRRLFDQTLVSVRSRWSKLDNLHALIGESPAIRLAMSRAQLSITAKCNVLVHGPEGVGKQEIAHGIFLGRLADAGLQKIAGQYFPIDCKILDATFIDGMLEVFAGRLRSETPALAQQLVLENLDQIPPQSVGAVSHWLEEFQSKCIAVGISRVGPEELAARGPDWQLLVAILATAEVYVPPLQERRDDIPVLAQHLLARYCRKVDRALLVIAPDAMDLLLAYSWPRNLTQLNYAIEEAVKHAVLTTAIKANHLPVEIRTYPGSVGNSLDKQLDPIDLDELLLEVERIVLKRALKLSPRNRAQVARWLGISRPRLLRRIEQLGLESPAMEQQDEPEN